MADEKVAKKVEPTVGAVVEVPTQFGLAFKIGEEVIDTNELLVRIYNDLQSMKKALL